MDVSAVFEKFLSIQRTILDFIDNDTIEINDPSFYNDLKNQIVFQDKNYFNAILHMLSNISEHHHRSNSFFQKIGQIIVYFKDYIFNHFTSSEITKIFQNNKRITLFLFNEGIINNEDFVDNCIRTNNKFLVLPEIEQNIDLFFQKTSIFNIIIYRFKVLFKEKFHNLINDYKVLHFFTNNYSGEYYITDKYDLNILGEIDFCDIYEKFVSFIKKEMDNHKDTLIKNLFFISSSELYLKYSKNCLGNYDLYDKNIIYKFMFVQFKSYQDAKVYIPNNCNEIATLNTSKKEYLNDTPSFYVQFSVKLITFLLCNHNHTALNYFILSEIEILHKTKNQNEKTILMSKINLFIKKMQKNKYNHSFSLKEFCLLVALFIDDIIEKLLEFEFTDFLQEIIALLKDEYQKNVEKSKMSREIQLGENDSYICKLIRDDSIEEFIIFVNQGNISLASSKIKYSICKTNTFLMNNEPTLIEYAVFFGSIQIFQYLILNGVGLSPSLWLYAIHGRNSEIIYILEENDVKPPGNTYKECILESIKCYHNEIADYLINNFYYLKENEICCLPDIIQLASIIDCNFEFHPRYIDFNSTIIIFCLNEFCPFLLQIICKEKNIPHEMLRNIKLYIDQKLDIKINESINFLNYDNDPFLNFISG